jgi:hypothetical protein
MEYGVTEFEAKNDLYNETDEDFWTETQDSIVLTENTKMLPIEDEFDIIVYVSAEDEAWNFNYSSFELTVDNVAPTLTNLLPTGTLRDKAVELNVETDQIATCKFDEQNRDYDKMSNVFESSDGLIHSYSFSELDYDDYKYYVKCSDEVENVGEGVIEFVLKRRSSRGGGSGSYQPPVVEDTLLFNEADVTLNYTEEAETIVKENEQSDSITGMIIAETRERTIIDIIIEAILGFFNYFFR